LPLGLESALILAVKKKLRTEIRRKLSELDPTVAHAKSMAACLQLVAQPEFAKARAIMIYLPMLGEVDIAPIALRGWQEQKIIAAPKISWDQRHMIPLEIRSLETGLVKTERPNIPDLREPSDGEPVAVDILDLVIVPAMAYDRKGNRLGRGAGFYDRFLASSHFHGVSVGLAFKEQVLDDLPVQENDVPVHMLVTDEEVLRFGRPMHEEAGKAGGRK
jgi:5-formyltetrahydrofolate cyclo-ligase